MKKKIYFVMLLVLSLTVLCGCKDGNKEKNDPVENGSSVYYGGKVTVGITQDLDSLDPHKVTAAGTKEVLYNIFEGLVKADKDGNIVPVIAESYEISEDGLKYTFKLRKDVKFHNGKALTADDVIYSLKRVAGMLETQDPEVRTVSAFSIFSEINKTEDGVEVVLSKPNTELIGFFTSSIIPCDYTEQATKPVGTGPFKFVSYEPLTRLVVEKNENYYVEGVPFLDGVTFKISASVEAAFLELMSGAIDIFPYLADEQAAQLEGRLNIEADTMNLVQALFLNNADPVFSDIRVRKAICYAIDRKGIVEMLSGGKGSIIGTNMFPKFGKYYNSETENYYPHNVQKAKELLKEAGYENGFNMTITIPSNYDFHVKTGEILVSQLKEVGINAEIQLVEWATWVSDIYMGRKYQSTVIGLDSQLAPSDVLRFYPSSSSKNFVNFFNDEFDALFEKAVDTVDEDEKAGYYKQLEMMLTENAVSAFIQSPVQNVAVSKKLSGYTFYPVMVQDMSTVYFTEKP